MHDGDLRTTRSSAATPVGSISTRSYPAARSALSVE
jgi:hypothetical protein